jgi:hypothetical protein
MKKLKLLAATSLLAAAIMPAQAVTLPLTLTGPAASNIYGPQSASNPCIIAGTHCTSSPLGFNNFSPNNDAAYDRWSTAAGEVNVPDGVQGTPYNALALAIAAGGVTFDVALDVNTTGAKSEVLQLFQVWDTTQNRLLYQYTGPTAVGNINNNGNGFGDWLIGSISLTGIGVLATDGIIFHAIWNGAVDGAESFFIVNGRGGTGPELFDAPGETPLPAAVWLFASGLSGFGWLMRQRKKKQAEAEMLPA